MRDCCVNGKFSRCTVELFENQFCTQTATIHTFNILVVFTFRAIMSGKSSTRSKARAGSMNNVTARIRVSHFLLLVNCVILIEREMMSRRIPGLCYHLICCFGDLLLEMYHRIIAFQPRRHLCWSIIPFRWRESVSRMLSMNIVYLYTIFHSHGRNAHIWRNVSDDFDFRNKETKTPPTGLLLTDRKKKKKSISRIQ